MIGYIIIYIVVGLIAGLIGNDTDDRETKSYGLMIVGGLISFLTTGPFVIATIIEMAIGFAVGITIRNWLTGSDKEEYNNSTREKKEVYKTQLKSEYQIKKTSSLKEVKKDSLVSKSKAEEKKELENYKLLGSLNSEYKKLHNELHKLKIKEAKIIDKIEQFEYQQFKAFGSIKLKLLSLKKENSQEAKVEHISFLSFYQKYLKRVNFEEKKYTIENIGVNNLNNISELKLKIQNINNEINHYKRKIQTLKEVGNYQLLLKITDKDKYFEVEREKIQKELDKLILKKEKKGLRIVKKTSSSSKKSLSISVDNELQNLKLELKTIEDTLQNLMIQKTEYLNNIEEFNTQYNLKLGDIIRNILKLKKEILYNKKVKQKNLKSEYEEEIKTFNETKETIDELKGAISELEEALENIDRNDENYDEIYKAHKELQSELQKLENELSFQEEKLDDVKEQLEDDKSFEEYEDVKSNYEEFENEYEHIKDIQKDIIELNDIEKKEIKKLYKKAARLCHPDIVADELKDKAHEIMQSLNEAYSIKDITKVKDILHKLEKGADLDVSSDRIEDKEILKVKIEEFKQTIKEVENEIEDIQNDETFKTINNLDDWDEYFENIKSELQKEEKTCVNELKKFLEEKEENNIVDEINTNSLTIELTSSKYLNFSYEVEMREKLYNKELESLSLSLEHDKSNQYDPLAIKVLCNNISIGYIIKYKDKEYINSFCFENNELKKLNVVFENDNIIIYLSDKDDKETDNYIGDGMWINDNDRWW